MLTRALNATRQVFVAAAVGNQRETRAALMAHHPDVILMDPDLGSENGLALVRQLREHYPVPILLIARFLPGATRLAVEASELGAVELLTKPANPTAEQLKDWASRLARRISAAAGEARPIRLRSAAVPQEHASFRGAGLEPARMLIALGASTGGTEAARVFLSRLSQDCPPVVYVQHIPAAFVDSYAQRLDRASAAQVAKVKHEEVLKPGMVRVAPGDHHVEVARVGTTLKTRITHKMPVNRHCPSVDVLFHSVAQSIGARAIGVLLTGMGDDGARGLLAMREAGALTVAQSANSCVVNGMPQAADNMGAVAARGTPEELPYQIIDLLSKTSAARH